MRCSFFLLVGDCRYRWCCRAFDITSFPGSVPASSTSGPVTACCDALRGLSAPEDVWLLVWSQEYFSTHNTRSSKRFRRNQRPKEGSTLCDMYAFDYVLRMLAALQFSYFASAWWKLLLFFRTQSQMHCSYMQFYTMHLELVVCRNAEDIAMVRTLCARVT